MAVMISTVLETSVAGGCGGWGKAEIALLLDALMGTIAVAGGVADTDHWLLDRSRGGGL